MVNAQPQPLPPLPQNSILSFDGGGVRGLSALRILQRIMWRVYELDAERQRAVAERLGQAPPQLPQNGEALPQDYFELICGTSTGGLIALMLGRLNMTTAQCIKQYSVLSTEVFGKRNSIFSRYLFDAKRLVTAVDSVVEHHLRTPDHRAPATSDRHRLFRADGDGHTKVFVVTLAEKDIERPCLLRSYASGPDHPGSTCTITEAAWATAAAPSFFKPPKLRSDSSAPFEQLVDGGIAYNNPAGLAAEELTRHRKSLKVVDENKPLIVSIGTGLSDSISVTPPRYSPRIVYLLGLGKELASLATSTKRVHARIQQEWPRERYFRFNVQSGLAGIRLDHFRALGDIHSATEAYLNDRGVQYDLDRCAKALFAERWKAEPLQYSAKRLWDNESAVGEWSLERVDARDPYPSQHPRVARPSSIEPIGSYVICADRPLHGSLRFSDSGVPAGEYTVVWIMSFFGSLPRAAADAFDDTMAEAEPDLFLIAGTPDKKFHETSLPPGQLGTTVDAADLKLFRGSTAKHTILPENWRKAHGYGWVEISSPYEVISVDRSGTVAFYISQPRCNYVARWCLGGVRLVPEGGTLPRPAVRQILSTGGEGNHQGVMSRPNSPTPAPRPNPRRARSASPQRPTMAAISAVPPDNVDGRTNPSEVDRPAHRVASEIRVVDDFDNPPPTWQRRKTVVAEPRTPHRSPIPRRMVLSREQSRRGHVVVTVRVAGDDSD